MKAKRNIFQYFKIFMKTKWNIFQYFEVMKYNIIKEKIERNKNNGNSSFIYFIYLIGQLLT